MFDTINVYLLETTEKFKMEPHMRYAEICFNSKTETYKQVQV